jgi:hypothetical protein
MLGLTDRRAVHLEHNALDVHRRAAAVRWDGNDEDADYGNDFLDGDDVDVDMYNEAAPYGPTGYLGAPPATVGGGGGGALTVSDLRSARSIDTRSRAASARGVQRLREFQRTTLERVRREAQSARARSEEQDTARARALRAVEASAATAGIYNTNNKNNINNKNSKNSSSSSSSGNNPHVSMGSRSGVRESGGVNPRALLARHAVPANERNGCNQHAPPRKQSHAAVEPRDTMHQAQNASPAHKSPSLLAAARAAHSRAARERARAYRETREREAAERAARERREADRARREEAHLAALQRTREAEAEAAAAAAADAAAAKERETRATLQRRRARAERERFAVAVRGERARRWAGLPGVCGCGDAPADGVQRCAINCEFYGRPDAYRAALDEMAASARGSTGGQFS